MDVTNDVYANNEESLGMSPDGQWLAGAWKRLGVQRRVRLLVLDGRRRHVGAGKLRPVHVLLEHAGGRPEFDQDAIPRVGPDGTVYVSWINGPNEKSLKKNVAMIDESTDGGATWGTDQVAAQIVSPIGGLLPNSSYRVFEDVHATVDQQTGRVVLTYTDQKSGASNIYATHNLAAGDITQWSAPAAVKASGQEQFFPWMSSAPNGRVDLVFYDRSCDAASDKLDCVTLASSADDGATWGYTTLLGTGFDGDHFHTCLAPDDPDACGRSFLGDYIAVASTDAKAQALWTGNGSSGMDVFSARATFSP